MNIFHDLQQRGLIKDVSNLEEVSNLLNTPTTIYCGFDPSAISMHLGNFVQISILMRLQRAGHRIIAVVGGATGMIGDPSGKSKERNLLNAASIEANTQAIKKQLERYLDFSDPKKGIVVNNFDWLGKLSMIDYLRDYGKYFPINYMLAKDVVANRLETGLSYTEFSYMMLQSIDFLHLYQQFQCRLQFGGSDQWGNLTSGLELIRKIGGMDAKAGVFTTPLITRSDGKKFGKSEDGALFLDASLTSPYNIYQYFYNVSDLDAIAYLKVFSFFDLPSIAQIEKDHQAALGQRIAQKRLAESVVTSLHSLAALNEAKMMSEVLFNGQFKSLSETQLLSVLGGLKVKLSQGTLLEDALIQSNLASSKREAREFIQGQSISINGETMNQLTYTLKKEQALFGKYIVLRRGKKLYVLIELQS
jgi:tyrosyl-tRNA synthetase